MKPLDMPRILDHVRGITTKAWEDIPESPEHRMALMAVLIDACRVFAQMDGAEVQRFWALELYKIADELAPGSPSEKIRAYLDETKS